MSTLTVFKIERGQFLYISHIDKHGRIAYTNNEDCALKFSDFSDATHYLELGYIVKNTIKKDAVKI